MVSIAVCDDDIGTAGEISQKVERLLQVRRVVYKMEVYGGSKFILDEIQDDRKFDLILLDIEMPEVNGINLANKIKEILPHCLIIFITSYEKYVYESFKVQPFRYIPKRCVNERLEEAVSNALTWIERNSCKYYQVENQQGMERIYLSDIIYIWHKGKYAYIEKINSQCTKVRKTLKQVFAELPKDDFVWIDRGCICNLVHIIKIVGGDALLKNNIKLLKLPTPFGVNEP